MQESGGIAAPFLSSALDGGDWSASCPSCFTFRQRAHANNWIGGWVGSRPSLTTVEKRKFLLLLGIRPWPYRPQLVTIPTEVSNSLRINRELIIYICYGLWIHCKNIKLETKSQSQSYFTTGGTPPISVLAPSPFRLMARIAVGLCQCIHYRVQVLWDSGPYFTVSDLRLPFSSPPMTCRATVEVFDPASTREWAITDITYSDYINDAVSAVDAEYNTLLEEIFCKYYIQCSV
jgi:hypothetical protein